jgi:hypothetical protein
LWIKTYGLEIIGEAENAEAFGLVLGVLSSHCDRSLNLTENYQEKEKQNYESIKKRWSRGRIGGY